MKANLNSIEVDIQTRHKNGKNDKEPVYDKNNTEHIPEPEQALVHSSLER